MIPAPYLIEALVPYETHKADKPGSGHLIHSCSSFFGCSVSVATIEAISHRVFLKSSPHVSPSPVSPAHLVPE